MKDGFVHLHAHTKYSLLDAVCHIEDLADEAKKMGMAALAVTDNGNLFGAIEFYNTMTKAGVRPIIGAEVYVAPESRFERATHGLQGASYPFVLLCKDETGYRNLIELITIGYLEGFYYRPRIDKEVLRKHSAGLIGLSGGARGEVSHQLGLNQRERALAAAREYEEILGKDHFYLEIIRSGIREHDRINAELVKLAEEAGIGLVATNDVHYLKREFARAHEVLMCIQTQNTLEDPQRFRAQSDQFYFKSPAEMRELFADLPQACDNTLAIAERCRLELDFSKTHVPQFEPPAGQTREEYLRQLTLQGLERRYGASLSETIRTRAEHELGVIQKSGYVSYFLIVWDFVHFAKSRGIPVGPGRGSAAGSIVSYALGITDIDPLPYDLLFERFLNPERVTMPDIDIDFCYENRDAVIQYVTEKYSKDNVAQIITFGTMMAKAVIRDVGRVLAMPYAEVDRIAKLVPTELDITIDDALEREPELKGLYKSNPQVKDLLDTSRILEGLARHASMHAAGVVISQRPLREHVPLFKAGDGQISTQFSMESLEKIGMLKMDFLGLRTLTVIDDTIKIIKRTRKTDVALSTLPLDDPKTFDLLSRAQSIGVFQVESGGMRDILKKLKPDKFEDLIAILALYRPGPIGSGMVDEFIKRKHGLIPIVYDHPMLEPILKDTYGIIVYQEQIMKIVNALAGFSLGKADMLRRAISKKKEDVMQEVREDFVKGCHAHGVDKKIADKIFNLIVHFAGYGFNKSHSAAYAMVSYQTAYLKANYPVEFMTALLSSEKDNQDKVVFYIDEAKRMGLKVLPPDVNESFPQFTVVGQDTIRFGLAAVKNVGQAAIDSIIQGRIRHDRFRSLQDFTENIDLRAVNRKVIESLIKCGAFDSTGFRRSQLTAILDGALSSAGEVQRDRQSGQRSFFDTHETREAFGPAATVVPDLPEWPEHEKLAFEKELLGYYVTGHPLDRYKKELRSYSTITSVTAVKRRDGEDVVLGGLVNKLKFTLTKKTNEKMAIVSVEDLQGALEALVFPRVFKDHGHHLVKDSILFFKGKLDKKEQDPKLVVNEIIPITDVHQKFTRSVHLRLPTESASDDKLQELQRLLTQFTGTIPVYLSFVDKDKNLSELLVDRTLYVKPSPAFADALGQLLGDEAVTFRS